MLTLHFFFLPNFLLMEENGAGMRHWLKTVRETERVKDAFSCLKPGVLL